MDCICVGTSDSTDVLFGACAAPAAKFLAVDGGDGFSVGVDASGAVIGWGSGFYGELTRAEQGASAAADDDGNDDDDESNEQQQPAEAAYVRIRAPPVCIALPERCTQVSCGASHVLVVTQSGSVYAWGWNRHQQVSPSTAQVLSRPSLVVFAAASEVTTSVHVCTVAAGGMHSLALDSAGRVWSWGDNTHGQLGVGSEGGACGSPAALALPQAAGSIAAGWAHSALLTDSHELFTFGFGLYHQLGHGTTENQRKPLAVAALGGLDTSCGGPIVQVACGNWHTAASGDVYTWGWGRDGQLGYERAIQTLPRVKDFTAECSDPDDPGHQAVDIACGPRQTLVLCASGELLWWGHRAAGGSGGRRPPELARHQICRRVAMGHSHALLLADRRQEELS